LRKKKERARVSIEAWGKEKRGCNMRKLIGSLRKGRRV